MGPGSQLRLFLQILQTLKATADSVGASSRRSQTLAKMLEDDFHLDDCEPCSRQCRSTRTSRAHHGPSDSVSNSPRTIPLPSSLCLDFRLTAGSVGQSAPFFAPYARQRELLIHAQDST